MFFTGGRPTARQFNTIINTQDLWWDPNFNCTTTAYANFPGAVVPFTKHLPATQSDIRVTLFASAFLDNFAPMNHTMGVNIASTDYDITYHRFNANQRHFAWSRCRRISGIAQGSYAVQLRVKNEVAARIVTYGSAVFGGSGGQIAIVVDELLL